MITHTWIKDTDFIPSLWLAPIAADQRACEAAVGRYIIGSVQSYDKRKGSQGADLHFFTFLVEESNVTEAHVYTAGRGSEKGTYQSVPFKVGEFYSLRASGNLFHQLKRYCTQDRFAGVPLRVEYLGTKSIKVKDKHGEEITAKVHQWDVTRDQDYIPSIGMQPVMQLSGPVESVGEAEDPLPPIE